MAELKEKTLNVLYSCLLETYGTGKELRSKDMLEHGLSYYLIKELIGNGVIAKVKNGYYFLTEKGFNDFFYYGKTLIYNKEKEKSILCFKRCYELNPNHLGTCFQLFLKSIQEKDYSATFILYEKLLTTENAFYAIDMKYYLCLLRFITDIPDKYREMADEITLDDIKIPNDDKRFKDIDLQNQIRTYVMQGRVQFALSRLNRLMGIHKKTTVQDIIAKELLVQASDAEKTSQNVVNNLIKEGNMEEIIQYLVKKRERHPLNIIERFAIVLSKKYLEIASSQTFLELKPLSGDSIFSAINANNFSLALEMSLHHDEARQYDSENSTLTLLLNRICHLYQEMEKGKQEENNISLDNNISVKNDNILVDDYPKIKELLQNQDWANAFSSLMMHLRSIGKEEYLPLIKYFITLSLMENELSFQKPLEALKQIEEDNYHFDLFGYTKLFHESLNEKNIRKAQLYVDMIDCALKLHTSLLHQKLLLIKENGFSQDFVDQSSDREETISKPEVQVTMDDNTKKKDFEEETIVKEKSTLLDSDKIFLAEKVKEIVKKEIILLDPMDDDRATSFIDYIKEEYQDISPLVIMVKNQQQIILRYRPLNRELVNVQQVIQEGRNAYKAQNYNECIKQYFMLLQTFEQPKSFVYALIAFSYMHLHNNQLAIEYFTIADALATKEGQGYDYKDKIMLLKGEICKPEVKPFFKVAMDELDYRKDTNNNYGIKNFDTVNHQIVMSKISSVREACTKLGLNIEETYIVLLIYAKRFYSQALFDKGDAFLNIVIKSGYKSSRIAKIINEIKKNRNFYQYRQTEKSQRLCLSLLP